MLHKSLISIGSKFLPILASVMMLAVANPASAIINGSPDGNLHPNAGAMSVPGVLFCSGVLISPSYFATAAHCVQEGLAAGSDPSTWLVTFSSRVRPADNPVTYHVLDATYDPNWTGANFTQGVDFGVLHLATPVSDVAPAHLPALGALNNLPHSQQNLIFETVGYGTYDVTPKKVNLTPGFRQYVGTYLANDNWSAADKLLKITAKQGGLCFGDSGGPSYLGTDTSIVVSINSGVDSVNCSAWGIAGRLDAQEAHDFYAPFD